jgi:hypothetical protein
MTLVFAGLSLLLLKTSLIKLSSDWGISASFRYCYVCNRNLFSFLYVNTCYLYRSQRRVHICHWFSDLIVLVRMYLYGTLFLFIIVPRFLRCVTYMLRLLRIPSSQRNYYILASIFRYSFNTLFAAMFLFQEYFQNYFWKLKNILRICNYVGYCLVFVLPQKSAWSL